MPKNGRGKLNEIIHRTKQNQIAKKAKKRTKTKQICKQEL